MGYGATLSLGCTIGAFFSSIPSLSLSGWVFGISLGIGSFIGPVHRIAASIDNKIELVSGAFSSTKDKSLLSGKNLFLDQDRIYGNFQEMFQKEKALSSDTRIDFVSIVTPNNSHYEIIMEALDSGFHVVCDKPITINSQQAIEVEKKVLETKKLFCLTHNYTGYPMVKEAKDMIYDNHLGNIRKIVVEYPQGWLATRIEGDTPCLLYTSPSPRDRG